MWSMAEGALPGDEGVVEDGADGGSMLVEMASPSCGYLAVQVSQGWTRGNIYPLLGSSR